MRPKNIWGKIVLRIGLIQMNEQKDLEAREEIGVKPEGNSPHPSKINRQQGKIDVGNLLRSEGEGRGVGAAALSRREGRGIA